MHLHGVNDIVFVYDPDSWVLVERSRDNPLGDTFTLAVRSGSASGDVFVQSPTFVDHDMLKFYGPSNMRRIRQTTGDITIQYVRRNRVESIDDLANEIPFEVPIDYKNYILSGPYVEEDFLREVLLPTSTYIKRTFTGQPFTYSFTEQVIDGFNADLHSLHVVCFQVPADDLYPVPRGHPIYRAISPTVPW
jgi:hypothetical protein